MYYLAPLPKTKRIKNTTYYLSLQPCLRCNQYFYHLINHPHQVYCSDRKCQEYRQSTTKAEATRRWRQRKKQEAKQRKEDIKLILLALPVNPESKIPKKLPKQPVYLGWTRGDCQGGPRPCPIVSCNYHLIHQLSNHKKAQLFKQSDDLIVTFICEMKQSCVLDIADQGGQSLEYIAEHTYCTRERIRQITDFKNGPGGAIRRLRHFTRRKYLTDFIGEGQRKGLDVYS